MHARRPLPLQDQHALDSWQRASEAAARGWTAGEIVPVEVPSGKGAPPKVVTQVGQRAGAGGGGSTLPCVRSS